MEYIRIFISHHMDDIKEAEDLKGYIDKQDYLKAVLVVDDSKPNELFEKQVEDGITGASYFVPILTCNSLKSIWVNQEIGFAKGYGVQIYSLIERDIMENLKGFIHKQREHFIFGPRSFKTKYKELVAKIKENEGLGEPNYKKIEIETIGDEAKTFIIDPTEEFNKKSLLHFKVELFDETQEFVLYFQFGSGNTAERSKYIGYSNSNSVDNSADHVHGKEHVYQFDLPGNTSYKKTINIHNIIKQSSLQFETFPTCVFAVRPRNMNGKKGLKNRYYYAFT